MPANNLNQWLKRGLGHWRSLAKFAAIVLGVIGTFLLPPPTDDFTEETKIWLRLGQFIGVVVLGLAWLTTLRWRLKKHLWGWAGVSGGALLAGVIALFAYLFLQDDWTARYDGKRVVVGSVLTEQGKAHVAENQGQPRDELVFAFAGRTEEIWARASIRSRRLGLAAVYLATLPVFAICVIALMQALHCAAGTKPSRKK